MCTTGEACVRKRMPSWICLAVEEQCVEWPAATAVELTLSPDAARELQSQLSEVRNSDRAALQRRLRMLVCDRESGIFFCRRGCRFVGGRTVA